MWIFKDVSESTERDTEGVEEQGEGKKRIWKEEYSNFSLQVEKPNVSRAPINGGNDVILPESKASKVKWVMVTLPRTDQEKM